MADSQTRTLRLNVVGDTSSGRKALDDLAGKGDETGGRIGKAFGELFNTLGSIGGGVLGPLGQGFNIVGDAVDKLGAKHVDFAGKLALGGTAIAGIGAALMGLGSADAQATAQLKQSIQNVGGSYDEFKGKIQEAIKQQENFGHSSAETTTALQHLTDATHDPAKAIDALSVAANLAAAKHEDLGTAVSQVIQIMEGKGGKTLRQYGLDTADTKTASQDLEKAQRDVTTATDQLAAAQKRLSDLEEIDGAKKKLTISDQIALRDAHNNVASAEDKLKAAQNNLSNAQDDNAKATQNQTNKLNELNDRVKGQAVASMDSFRGRIEVVKTKLEDVTAAIGEKFGPALTIAGTSAQTVAALLEIGSSALELYRVRHAAAAAAALEDAAAGDVYAESMAADIGITLGGILALEVLTVGLGLGIYELATHWSTAWGFMKDAALGAWHFVDDQVVHPVEGWISGFTHFVGDHWAGLLLALTNPFAAATAWIFSHLGDIENWVGSMPSRIARASSGMWDGIKNAFRGAVNAIIGWWDNLSFGFPAIDFGPIHLSSWTWNTPNIPYLDTGGIAVGPTLAALSMNSIPEAVIPLPMLNDMLDGGGRASKREGDHIEISVQAETNADANQIAQEAAWQFKTMPKAS